MSFGRDILESILGIKELGLTNKGLMKGSNLNSLAFRDGKYTDFDDVYGVSGFYTDFLGKTMTAQIETKVGSDNSNVLALANAGGVNGEATMTTGASTTTMAVNGTQAHTALNYEAQNGRLYVEAKLKVSAITSLAWFVGFTDQVSALEMPINGSGSGNGITTNCSDGVGFLFDTVMTSAGLWAVGVKGDTDATSQNLGVAYAANTYITLRVELNDDETATFFINGKKVGTSMAAAATKTVPLTPVIAGFSRTSATRVATVDYLTASQNRVAGVI